MDNHREHGAVIRTRPLHSKHSIDARMMHHMTTMQLDARLLGKVPAVAKAFVFGVLVDVDTATRWAVAHEAHEALCLVPKSLARMATRQHLVGFNGVNACQKFHSLSVVAHALSPLWPRAFIQMSVSKVSVSAEHRITRIHTSIYSFEIGISPWCMSPLLRRHTSCRRWACRTCSGWSVGPPPIGPPRRTDTPLPQHERA